MAGEQAVAQLCGVEGCRVVADQCIARWSATAGTLVVGVHVGFVDTDATVGLDVPKVPAAEVASQTMDAISRDVPEVLVDEVSRRVRAALSGPVELLDPEP